MAELVKITGFKTVLNNLKKADSKLGKEFEKRLIIAGLFVQRESQKIAPVDEGTLHGSARTDPVGKGFDTDVIVHYGAGPTYAVYVHENLDARHKPGKKAKYLESVVREKKLEIFKIIAGK